MSKLRSIVPTLFISIIDWLAHTLGIGVCIHPSIIPWMTDIICVIVDTCSAFMVHIPWFDRHEVSIIVVRKEDRHFESVSSMAIAYRHREL
jgi:hypothetical protein